jgi:hypothetical protein
MQSLDSGNMSENDEINKLEKSKNKNLRVQLGRIHSMSDNDHNNRIDEQSD